MTDSVRSKGGVVSFLSEANIYYSSIGGKGRIILFLSEEGHLLMFVNLEDYLSIIYIIQC
jgi:hypothetical protein